MMENPSSIKTYVEKLNELIVAVTNEQRFLKEASDKRDLIGRSDIVSLSLGFDIGGNMAYVGLYTKDEAIEIEKIKTIILQVLTKRTITHLEKIEKLGTEISGVTPSLDK
jgi:hypothetical protein